MHCLVYWYTLQRQSMTDIVLLPFESGTRCICMVPLRICNSTVWSVYLISTHKTQRMSGQQLINSLHRITCSLIFSTITVYVMTERASWSYLRRLLYRHLNLRPLGLLSHAPFCHLSSLILCLCYISLFLYTVVSAFILVCLIQFQKEKGGWDFIILWWYYEWKLRFSAWHSTVSSQDLRCFVQSFQACSDM